MQSILKLFFPLVASQRDINSPEYQSLSKKALQPSFQLNFEEYQFNKTGDLKTFLPIHDDTWGEFLIKQKGHDGKFNFIQHRIAETLFDKLQPNTNHLIRKIINLGEKSRFKARI